MTNLAYQESMDYEMMDSDMRAVVDRAIDSGGWVAVYRTHNKSWADGGCLCSTADDFQFDNYVNDDGGLKSEYYLVSFDNEESFVKAFDA
jgi:hypothetical protein